VLERKKLEHATRLELLGDYNYLSIIKSPPRFSDDKL